MLFNKHSETKQRFGIRKLTIGVSSVLLSTLFLTVNNGQKVNAATGDTVTNSDSNKASASVTKETEANKSNNGSSSVSLTKDATKVTNTSNGTDSIEKQKPEVEDKSADATTNGSAKADDTKATEDKTANNDNEKQNQQQDKTATDAKSSDTSEKSEKAATTANNKLAKAAVNKFAAKAEVGAMENEKVDYTSDGSARTGSNAAFPVASTSGLSDDGLVATDDQGVTLSMSKNTLGEGGQLGKSGITVKLSGTVNAGDIYTIQVPDFGWGYGLNDSTITTAGALGNFATAKKTKVVIDGQNYANYQITFKQGITIDSKGFQIFLNNGNNYYGQGRPSTTIKDGIYDQNIYWSRSSQADPTKITENSTLSFTRKVETGFNKPTFTMTAPDGNKVTKLEPDTDYQFTLNLNQGTGLNGLTDHTSSQINSARNYGSVITIPVPEGFVLNQALSMQGSQIEDETTIEQVGGAGGNIIINVPKGSGRQNYESKPGYIIAGRFITHPKTTTTFTANGNGNENGNITVTEKVLTKDGTGTKEIKAVLPPWQITMLGQKDAPTEGEFAIQAWGNNNGNRFTQTVPTKIANYFNFTNNSGLQYENNLHLTFDFDDGLAISALSTPKIDDIARYGTRSYTYTLTLTDGTKITGRINAGDKIEIPDKTMTITAKSHDQDGKVQFNDMVVPVTIKSADLVPNFWAAGAHGDNFLNYRTGGNFGNNQFISNETFMAYGYISDALNNDPYLPDKTYVSSKLTVSSPSYRPNTTFYATDTQLVASKNTIQSALWASGSQHAYNRYYSPDIDYTKGDYGTISIDVSNDSKKASNRIVEPIFYYVLPNYTNFTGDLTNIINPNPGITDGDKSKENIKPKLTSYMVGNQQVVKLDYSGTGFVYDANKKSNTLPIAIDADAEPGVYKWNVYIYTATGIVNQNPITNASDVANDYTQNVVEEQKNAGKTGSLYMIGSGDWEIKTPPVAYAPNTVQGNLDVKSVANGKSDDKGSEEMNYATEIANYSSGSIKDPYMLINFPQADPKNGFTFELTGPEEFIALNNNLGKDDFTTYYSTKTQDLPTVKDRGKVPDMTGYVTAGQVTDWSKIKSAVIKFNTTLPGGTVLGQIVFKGKDSTLKTDAGKTSYFRAAVMGETINPFLTENTSIKVVGKSTINTRLHYQDTDRQDHYINVPTMTKEYNDNVDRMKSSDFVLNSIPKELIPDHYELVANQVPSIINNEDGNSKDATAEFNKTVTYAFDGDIVQFELAPKIDKATQTINRTVHFMDDNNQKVARDVSTPVTVTELTNEVTGEKQYSAKITVNGQTQYLPVLVGQNGQISLTLPKVDIPAVSDYYVVDSTKTQADAISKTFAFTKDGTLTFENTVKYAPVKQELQIKVYDDESNTPGQALDTTDSGATTDFTGNSKSDFPADVATNLEALKAYYENKNYVVETLPAATGKFDSTDNGSGADKQVQVLEVHLKHAKDVKTESIKVVREVTYSVDSKSPDAPKAPDAKVDTFDGVFSRTVTTDKVNKNVTKSDWSGTYTSDGVTSPKLADGYHPDKEVAAKATISADFLKNAGEDEIAQLMSDGLKVSDEVVYSADKQTVKIRVYDDTTDSELSPVTAKSELEGQGKNVEISLDGLTNSDIPAEFSSNIDLLKSYYESKGYKFVSNTDIPAKFDATSNGTGQTDSTPQYVDIHLEHALSLEKETKTVTRTINYYDQDQNKLINEANPKVTEAQTIEQKVDFERYAVRDQVTKQIIGYATPDQVTTTGDQTTLKQADGFTHTTGEASEATAAFVVTSDKAVLPSQVNYDLSKYGYEAPTDKNGKSFAQIDEVTPLPTDKNTVVNVYYREKVVTVTVDNPPTAGTKVPGTDTEFPPNNWDKDVATNVSTRTIHYVYDKNTFVNGKDVSGQPVPGLKDIEQTVVFTQSAKINLVTGVVSYRGDWKAHNSTTTNQQGETITTDGGNSFAEVASPSSKTGYPELKGYTPHQEVVNAAKATHGVNAVDIYVKYVGNDSLVQIKYVDEDTGHTLKVDTKNGKSGETFDYSTTDTIADYEKSGYELVHDGFTENDGNLNNKTFDSYDDVPDSQRPETINQKWKVTLKHKKITVTNDDPKDPDDKITTDKGYDHNYPTGVSETDLNNTVRRNISFIYTDKPEGSNQAFPTETQEVAYKRQATIDLVKLANGDSDAVSYSNWEPKEAGKESFDRCQVKPIKGYVANYELVPSADVYKDQDGKAENGQDVVVKYSPVGKIIPIDKDGNEIPNAPTPKYNNDPTDPTKTTTTDVPEIPGYHAEVPNVTPDNPLEDTKVVYVKNTQVIDLVYVDTKTNTTLTTQNDVEHGDSGSTIPTSVTDTLNSTIQSYLDKGYVIDPDKVSGTVPDTFDFSDQTADGADKEHQVVTIYLTHGTVTVTGNDPKTPGEPINPKDPNGSKYPPEAGKDNLVISSQNIIHYYDEAGNKILDDKVNTDDSTLTRTVTIDKVTGKVTNTSDWTGGKEYENVNTPVVNGYYVDKASASAGASTVTPADADPNSGRVHNGVITNETTVIYHPMGHIIPIDKSGNKIPGAETPIFNNDPKDPTKASTTNSPIIPGYHLETPSDSAITPDEPGTNRLVVYVADTQELKVQVFDLDGDTPDEPLKTDKTGATVDFTGDSFTNFPSDVATNVDSLIKYYTDRGYLVKTKPSDEELSGKFDGDKTQTQYLKLQLVHDKTTVSGEDENTPVPDTLINENDPDSVKYPSDVRKDNLVISSEVIIHYEGAGEKTPKDVIRTVDKTLTRTVTIDKVTGKVINTSDWKGNKEYDAVLTTQIQGYTSDNVQVDKVSITKDNAGEAKNGKITYTFNVVYTPDKQQFILKVHDEDTQSYLGDPVIFDGYTDQEVGNSPVDKLEELKKKYLDLGYEIVETPRLDKNYDDTPNVGGEPDKKPQVFVLKVKHRIVPVTPDDPKTPDDIIPDSNQNYPGGLTETDLSRTITRTIVVNFPSVTSQEIKQVVTYTRTATVDAVTKEVKYSAWTTKNSDWPEQVTPTVPGYTPDKDKVDLTYVPVDGKDVTVEINYNADPEPDEPTTPVKTGELITPVKPTKPSKPKKPAKQTKPEVVKPVKETKGKQLYGSAQAKVDSKAAQNVVDKNKANGTNDKKLPQTNSESDWQLSLLGVGVLALALLVLKKKRDDE